MTRIVDGKIPDIVHAELESLVTSKLLSSAVLVGQDVMPEV